VVLPVLLLHRPILHLPFLSDDYNFGLLLRDGQLHLGTLARELWTGWGGLPGAIYWRPLISLSAACDFLFFGADLPAGFHLHNLLLHLLNSLLVAQLLRTLAPGAPFWRSAAAGLFFGIHPATVEASCWIAGRVDTQSTFLYLASLLAFLGYRRVGTAGALRVSLVLFAIGLGSKETVLTLPALVLLADLALILGGFRPCGIGARGVAARFLGVLAIALVFRLVVLGRIGGDYPLWRFWLTPSGLSQTIPNLGAALRVMLVPWNEAAMGSPLPWAFAVLVLVPAAVLVWTGGLRKLLGSPWLVALALTAVPLAMVAGLPIGAKDFANARLLYLPLAGVSLLLFLPPPRSRFPSLFTPLLAAAVVALTARGLGWSLRLWADAGSVAEAVAMGARDEAHSSPRTWVVLTNVPDREKGVWVFLNGLIFALRRPFSPFDCPRVVPLLEEQVRQDPALPRTLVEVGARFVLWDRETRAFYGMAKPESFGPRTREELDRIPPLERWLPESGAALTLDQGVRHFVRPEGSESGLVSPSMRLSPFGLRALELEGAEAGTWEVSWPVDAAGRFTNERTFAFDAGRALPGRPVVVPLFNHPQWYLPPGPPITRLRLAPPAGSRDVRLPRLRCLAGLPDLAALLPDAGARVRPSEGLVLRFPEPPAHLLVYLVSAATPVLLRPVPEADGTVRLTPADLAFPARVVESLGTLDAILFAEARARPDDPMTVQARTSVVPIVLER
jgi:hypothetical protein